MVKSILLIAAVYYLLCGLSAILVPSAWTVVTGIDLARAPLALELIGILFIALGFGAGLASREPKRHIGIVYVLLLANLLDTILVVKAIVAAQIPQEHGIVLAAVDAAWCALLYVVTRRIDSAECR